MQNSAPCQPIPSHWGSGGASADTQAVRHIEKALTARWSIPRKVRRKIPRILAHIALHSTDVRAQTAAARVLGIYDNLNMQQERRDTGEDRVKGVLHFTVEDIDRAREALAARQPTQDVLLPPPNSPLQPT